MAVTNVNNGMGVNWDSLINALNGSGEAGKTVNVDTVNKTVTFTVAGENGATREVTASIPDLDIPETVDAAAIEGISAKLTALSKEGVLTLSAADIESIKSTMTEALEKARAEGIPSASGKRSKSVMFDIYALMAVLIEVAQKQRDATRQMRLSENQSVQKSIQNQAEQQKTAAWTGLMGSLACSLLQAAVSIGALKSMSSAFNKQLTAMQQGGVNSARQNVQMMTAMESEQSAQNQLNAVAGKTTVGMKASVRADGFGTADGIKAKIQNLQADSAAKNGELAQLNEAKTNPGGVNRADLKDPKVIEAYDKMANNKAELAQKVTPEQAPKAERLTNLLAKEFSAEKFGGEKLSVQEQAEKMSLSTELGEKITKSCEACGRTQSNFTGKVIPEREAALQKEVKANDDQITGKLRSEYRSAVKDGVEMYENKYQNALYEQKNLPKTATAAERAAANQKVVTAESELKYARAYGYRELAGSIGDLKVTTKAEYQLDMKTANDASETLAASVQRADTSYLKAMRAFGKAEMLNMLFNSLGNAFQSMVSAGSQLSQAEATKAGAETEKSKEELDQTKDLFSQAESLVNDVIQLLQAVIQAEAQSMRDAIQA
ncbi:MAG: hypothetical protein K6F50_04570 [Kiritimatiellae bacterium]|nr:hypothetical protein [Kiritimatiellia bacterium]